MNIRIFQVLAFYNGVEPNILATLKLDNFTVYVFMESVTSWSLQSKTWFWNMFRDCIYIQIKIINSLIWFCK